MSLALDPVVTVNISLTPAGVSAPVFNVGRCMSKNVLPYYDRVRTYANLTAVLVDFASNSQEYAWAQEYFAQLPAPASMQIARQFVAAQSGVLRGGALADTNYLDYQAITNGGFDININGANHQITALNFSAAGSMAAIAADLQTALAAAVAGTTCTWNSQLNCFVISVAATTGTGSTIAPAVAPTGGGSPTDESVVLGFANSAGAKATPGCAGETMTVALTSAQVVNPGYFALGLTTDFSTQDNKDTMAFAMSNRRKFYCTHQDPNVLALGNTTNLSYYAQSLGYTWICTQYSSSNPYAAISWMARELIVNYSQPKSDITIKFKQEPGVAAENLTEPQTDALESYNCNVYVNRGGFSMIENGVMADGTFSDIVNAVLAWYQSQVQVNYFNVLATAPTKVAQTDTDVQRLVKAIDMANQAAVNAGIFAPGVWNGNPLGAVNTGDFLKKGYYTYAPPVATQSPTDRAARKAPPITSLVCGAGAIQSGNVQINFQQ
jgi:hypothetical protein